MLVFPPEPASGKNVDVTVALNLDPDLGPSRDIGLPSHDMVPNSVARILGPRLRTVNLATPRLQISLDPPQPVSAYNSYIYPIQRVLRRA